MIKSGKMLDKMVKLTGPPINNFIISDKQYKKLMNYKLQLISSSNHKCIPNFKRQVTSLFNLNSDDIEKPSVNVIDKVVYYYIKLKRKEMICDYCGFKMIGHGTKSRIISHPNIRGFNGVVNYI